MAFVRAGDLIVHYDLTGPPDAPTILFANSLGTNFHVWDPQAAALVGRFRVLRYDMRGHGLTECPPASDDGYSVDRLAKDAVALLDVLQIGSVHFIGLSVGGMVGQRLAATAPDRVLSLTLCDTASRIGPASRWDDRIAAVSKGGLEAIADAVLKVWFTPDFLSRQPDTARGYANMLVRTPAQGYIGCCAAIRDADLRQDDARIQCPTLVVVGDQDPATPPSAARELSEAIRGARLETIEGAAHIPAVEQPAILNRLLGDFLDTHAGATEEPKRRRV
jgi:3-oxoadipate enol-lactonase